MDSALLIKDLEKRMSEMTAPDGVGVIPKTTPVVSFGDFTSSHIATIGINPSSNEFMTGASLLPLGKKRLADSEIAQANFAEIWHGCQNYFQTPNTYWKWFRPLEDLLKVIGHSYLDSACHLDLSPWATFPAFSDLSPVQQNVLLSHDKEFLIWQIAESPIKTVLFNGRKVYETISASQNFYLQKVGEFKYTTGGRPQTSDLISGDGPMGESIFGWTVNIQAMQVTSDEKQDVMEKISSWLRDNLKN